MLQGKNAMCNLMSCFRMENTVLGNALEGVPEESEEELPNNSNIESANNLDGQYEIFSKIQKGLSEGNRNFFFF